ncbi:MAG: Bifunctional primase/polymerase [Phycisphaerales bacterium]|nr:Bifunctional primase/polymerase [Phycisphaerales bacterium]
MTATPDTMLSHALAYAARGWRVLPLRPRTKHTFAGIGSHDATTDPAKLAEWWARWPDANVGLATGTASNLAVVDQDVDPAATPPKNGPAEWARLTAGRPIGTAAVGTGRGGLQLYFLDAGRGCRNSQGRLAPGIDTRGEGGYVVAPPSIHPNGQRYDWAATPDEIPLAELPAWVADAVRPADDAGNLAGLVDHRATPGRPSAALEAAERCRRYMELIPDAVSGSGGHNATLRAAAECFRFGLTESAAWDLLTWFNGAKCHPAWSERELRRKLTEGRKLVDREGKFGARLEEGGAEADWPTTWRPTEPAVPVDRTAGELHADPESAEPAAPLARPVDHAGATGLLGDTVRWMNATAYKPQPVLALANALAFWGAVLGRRVQTATGLRSNIYALGVGESGCGKDHSRKCVKRITDAAGLTAKLLGGERIKSDSALENAVHLNPSILFQLDEIGHWFGQAGSKYAAGHEQAIAPLMMSLFSSASTTYIGAELAGRERKDIDQPNACLYGTTTPTMLWSGLTTAEISNGFLNRMLVFVSPDPDPDPQSVAPTGPPDEIPAAVAEWVKAYDTLPAVNLLMGAHKEPHTIHATGEAESVFRQFERECRGHRAGTRDGRGLDSLWSRAPEHAAKVALIAACCGAGKDGPAYADDIEIDHTAATFGVRLAETLTHGFADAAGANVVDSEFGRALRRVRSALEAAGERGLTPRELARGTNGMDPSQRAKVLGELCSQGAAVMAERKGKAGPGSTVYVLGSSATRGTFANVN